MATGKKESLQQFLDDVLAKFNGQELVESDPIKFVYRYQDKSDREVVALISALFSFGNVKAIFGCLENIFSPMGNHPFHFLKTTPPSEIKKIYKTIYYRFYRSHDIQNFLIRCGQILRDYGDLESAFRSVYQKPHLKGLKAFRDLWLCDQTLTGGLKFMFPDPEANAAKRWHMWMRWMIRRDGIDLGLWDMAQPSDLILPLDTHLFDIGKKLGLTKRKAPSLLAAIEVTESLKIFSHDDPLKYDFALCRIGVLGYKKSLLQLSARQILGGAGNLSINHEIPKAHSRKKVTRISKVVDKPRKAVS